LVDNHHFVVEDSDDDPITALADVTADGASKDGHTGHVPLVTHACPACVLLAQRPGGDLQEGIQEEVRP
jgi:hypothetical protein